jgi:hypothetical protein
MSHAIFATKKNAPACASILISLVILSCSVSGQTPNANPPNKTEQELISTEFGFFEAWKTKNEAYFRTHMTEDGIFWDESGTVARDEHLQQQQAEAKTCKVDGYGLSDFGLLPLVSGAFLLTYKVDQYAACNGEKLPVHMNGSSIYVLKSGHWMATYRAEVPLQNQR